MFIGLRNVLDVELPTLQAPLAPLSHRCSPVAVYIIF